MGVSFDASQMTGGFSVEVGEELIGLTLDFLKFT
jgi:hypothetical protein